MVINHDHFSTLLGVRKSRIYRPSHHIVTTCHHNPITSCLVSPWDAQLKAGHLKPWEFQATRSRGGNTPLRKGAEKILKVWQSVGFPSSFLKPANLMLTLCRECCATLDFGRAGLPHIPTLSSESFTAVGKMKGAGLLRLYPASAETK